MIDLSGVDSAYPTDLSYDFEAMQDGDMVIIHATHCIHNQYLIVKSGEHWAIFQRDHHPPLSRSDWQEVMTTKYAPTWEPQHQIFKNSGSQRIYFKRGFDGGGQGTSAILAVCPIKKGESA